MACFLSVAPRLRGAGTYQHKGVDISPPLSRGTPGVFYTYFYNHAHRLRLEKLLYLELSTRSTNGFLKPLVEVLDLASHDDIYLVMGARDNKR
jgi:hypothetical protein